MKKDSKSVWGLVMLLVVAMSVGLSSCHKKDDVIPETIDNPLDEEVYYISGKVTADSKELADVKVTATDAEATTAADGTFQLVLKKRGEYTVSFEKSGYVPVSAYAEIAADAKKQSSVSLIQELTAKSLPVTVTPDADQVVIDPKNTTVELFVPAGAVTEATEVTVTTYTEGAKKIEQGTTRASLTSFNCEPDGMKFETPVTLRMENPVSSSLYFANVKHLVEKNGKWVEEGTVEYRDNNYITQISGFSNHSFSIDCDVLENTMSSQALPDIVIDNLGEVTATEEDINFTQHVGWKLDAADALGQLEGLSATDIALLSGIIESVIASYYGTPVGVSEITQTRTVGVNGDTKMTISLTESIIRTDYSFDVVYKGVEATLIVPAEKYDGVMLDYKTEAGTLHSGGKGH